MKKLLIQYFAPIVITAVSGVFTSLTSLLIMKTKKWVESKTKIELIESKRAEDKLKNELIASAIERVTRTAETVVDQLNQTVVAKLKAAASDGKLTSDDALSIKKTAIDTVKMQLTEGIKENAALGINDLTSFIESKVEQAVGKLKTTAGV